MGKLGDPFYPFDTNYHMLTLQTCVEDVIKDGTNTILLIPESEMDTNDRPSSEGNVESPRKRIAKDHFT